MFYYIYKTTQMSTGKIYIGKHHSKKVFDPKYLGSGRDLGKAIKEFGISDFSVEPIFYAFDRETLNISEIHFIAEYNARNPEIGFNIHPGGQGFNCTSHTPETKEKIKRNRYCNNDPETNRKRSETLKGRKRTQQEIENVKKGIANMSEEKKNERSKRLSESSKARPKRKDSDETRLKKSIARLGKKHSEETRRKISEIQKGKTLSPEHIEKLKGKKQSQETIDKRISKTKGKNRTPEQRQRIKDGIAKAKQLSQHPN